MNIFAPNYYKKFKCIAGDCKHNCCIGWEIDIDKDTYRYYLGLSDNFGKNITKHISFDDGIPYFTLDENDCCPFLMKNGLCEIISNLGEDKLCQICTDHPRFRNYFQDHIEIGIGLCCEAAAEIIINQKENMYLESLNNDNSFYNETDFSIYRNKLFDILQNNQTPVDIRLKNLLEIYGINIFDFKVSGWAEFFLSLEYMEDTLKELFLKLLTKSSFDVIIDKYNFAFLNLTQYFIYRYLPRGIYDENMKEIVSFSVLNSLLINELFMLSNDNDEGVMENLIELSRLYSAEIEYSEENVNKILDKISEFNIENS